MDETGDTRLSHDNVLWWLFRILSEECDPPAKAEDTGRMIGEKSSKEEGNNT